MTKCILIGIDGMTQMGFKTANTPIMNKLIDNGILINNAINQVPTVSKTNWLSMLSGVSVKRHHVKNNDNIPKSYGCKTVYHHIKKQYPNSNTALIYEWDGIYDIIKGENINYVKLCSNISHIENNVSKCFKQNPDFIFIHYVGVDKCGHKFGYNTPKYIQMISRIDKSIGKILGKLNRSKLINDYSIIISTDHGGDGKSHGGISSVERRIPIILSGNIIKKYQIRKSRKYSILDIAPTILNLLQIKTRFKLDGKSILEDIRRY